MTSYSPPIRGATATYKCKCCGNSFIARTADRDRGWAKFCSKSCKAVKKTQHGTKYPRHDGKSPMKYKVCETCGNPAINGARNGDQVEWYCEMHEYEARLNPFDSDALGQWS